MGAYANAYVEMQLVDFVSPARLNDREPEPRREARFE
jgi:hypothetical protein